MSSTVPRRHRTLAMEAHSPSITVVDGPMDILVGTLLRYNYFCFTVLSKLATMIKEKMKIQINCVRIWMDGFRASLFLTE